MAELAEKAASGKPDESNTTATDNLTQHANKLVRNYSLGSALIGAIPLPIVDLAALAAVQLKMLHGLSKVYGVEFSDQLGKSLIASLLGGGLSLSLSTNLASLVKTVPIYGTATGMVSVAVFGGASSYAIGKVFIQHFESGGTFLNFDPERVREYYAEQFEQGKKELKKSVPGKKP
ncbi:MAG: YcjF family protein [Gammaproteobacteria bacterium]